MSTTSFSRYHGNDAVLLLALTHPDTGAAFDPKDHFLLFAVKLHPAQADAEAPLRKVSTEGGFQRLAANGVNLKITLRPADWAGLLTGIAYYFDVLAQRMTDGRLLTVASGRLTPLAVVTAAGPFTIVPAVPAPITDEKGDPMRDELGAPITG